MRHAFDTAAGRLLIARAGNEAWDEAKAVLHENRRPTAAQRNAWAHAPHLIAESGDVAGSVELAVPIETESSVLAALAVNPGLDEWDEKALKRRVAPQLERAAHAISRTVGHG